MKKVQPCLGKNIFSLNLTQIEAELKKDPRIKGVLIKRRFPQSILIEVQEKMPILWLSLPAKFPDLGEWGFCGLSIDQEIIPLDQEDLYRDLPMVTGIESKEVDPKTENALKPYRKCSNLKVAKALELYSTLLSADPDLEKLLAEINLRDISDPIVYLLPGVKVMMGLGDFKKKWRRVKTILAMENKVNQFLCLDLRFDDQVVLTDSSRKAPLPEGKSENPPDQTKVQNL